MTDLRQSTDHGMITGKSPATLRIPPVTLNKRSSRPVNSAAATQASQVAKKVPNPIDRHVGSRVRMRRMMLGMSQEKLGDALGLTFQQVQKYEKGANRIGASRLQQISQILQVPVSFFFAFMANSFIAFMFSALSLPPPGMLGSASDFGNVTRTL